MDATTEPRIKRRDTGALCTLTLNRPDKLNALDEATFEELAAIVDDLEKDERLGCVVLRGAGRSFCAGNDLDDIAAGRGSSDPHFRGRTIERLARIPQPLVVQIHGHCYTGGLELALAGDLLFAAESAMLGDTHGKFGLTPLWGMSQRLPRRIGLSRAKELMFTSRAVPAPEALSIGLVDGCVPDDLLADEIAGLATAILENSVHSNRANKRLMLETEGMRLAEGLAYEREHSPGMGPDARERIAAFSKRGR